MSYNFHKGNRLARHPGNQGARPSGGNQPEVEKFASGTINFPPLPVQVEDPWPQYLVINVKEGSLSGVSSVRVSNQLNGMLEKYECKRQKGGSIMIKVDTKSDSERMLECTKLFGRDVEVKPHGSLNTCKGVIRSYESINCTDEELNEWFNGHRIESFYRIKKHYSDSETLILTFQGQKLPEIATVGFERCRVRPFIPNPRRCYKCQRFGHISKFCKQSEACAQCGSNEHSHTRETPCMEEPWCVNCKGQHAAFDRRCPRLKVEKEAQRLKTIQNIPMTQAIRLAEQSTGHPVTYASTVTSSQRSIQGPRSSPRASPRNRVQLNPNERFYKENACAMTAAAFNKEVSASANDNFERLKHALEKINPMGSIQKKENGKTAKKRKCEDDKNNPVAKIRPSQNENEESQNTSFETIDTNSSGDEEEKMVDVLLSMPMTPDFVTPQFEETPSDGNKEVNKHEGTVSSKKEPPISPPTLRGAKTTEPDGLPTNPHEMIIEIFDNPKLLDESLRNRMVAHGMELAKNVLTPQNYSSLSKRTKWSFEPSWSNYPTSIKTQLRSSLSNTTLTHDQYTVLLTLLVNGMYSIAVKDSKLWKVETKK